MDRIQGGYYIKARKIKESSIAHAPPHVREIWDYLIREANHQGQKRYGETLERGQVFTSYDDIREDLHWMIGWRKHRYTKAQCEIAMKFLRSTSRNGAMIATRKTTRGMIITILNYDFYQDPKNYESHSESHNENHNETCSSPQTSDTIDKNVKNEKKEERININTPLPPKGVNGSVLKSYPYPDWLNKELWSNFAKMRSRIKKPITTEQTIKNLLSGLQTLMGQYPQESIIQSAIDGCWQKFYPPKNGTSSGRLTTGDRVTDANLNACKEFIEDGRIG